MTGHKLSSLGLRISPQWRKKLPNIDLESVINLALSITPCYIRIIMDSTEHKINRDQWVAACGGSEKPFKAPNGLLVWYMWNRKTGEHAYLNVKTDIFLTQEEVEQAFRVNQ
jgi:hypothetical protein